MYIIYESIALNDPRLEYVERHGDYWMYTVGYVAPENEGKVDLKSLNAVKLPDAIALAARFSWANILKNNGYMKFRVSDGGVNDLFPDNTLDEPSSGSSSSEKSLYKLTDVDMQNATDFLKIMMTLELENHYAGLSEDTKLAYSEKFNKIKNEINTCAGLLDAQRLMHNRFDCEATNSQRELEKLNSPKWDLSIPGMEIRLGSPRMRGTAGVK